MSRQRKSHLDQFLDTMETMPWWVSIALGSAILGILFLTLGSLPAHHPMQMLRSIWWLVPVIFGAAALGSLGSARRARVSLLKRETLRDLQSVPWKEFELLVGAYYREKGFTVVQTGGGGPDEGVDLVLRKNGERVLVQCKKYVRDAVGVQTIREFFGVIVAKGAHRGIFITTGNFTADAMQFGLGQASLELIPGQRFAEMISHLRKGGLPNPAPAAEMNPEPSQVTMEAAPCCPRCASVMVNRKAGKGANAGKAFWGCPNFPACRGTREVG